jgi:FAD/FMN-containing dehydrogenase
MRRCCPRELRAAATAATLRKAILWCREHDVPLATRSGGHSYAGFSTTRGLMIDVGPMNTALFAASTGTVTIGGGIGFNMREAGLGCDQVVATEIVTADGGCTG